MSAHSDQDEMKVDIGLHSRYINIMNMKKCKL
jgi:hypothetical protein